MDLRSLTEAGAFPLKAEGRSARRAGVGWGIAGTVKAFVSGAGSRGAILTESAGRFVWGEAGAAADGTTAFDASAAETAMSSQQAGLARKYSTARMKLTAYWPTAAGFSLDSIRCGRQSTSTVTPLPLGSRWAEPQNIQHPTSNGRALANHWMLGVRCWMLDVR